VPPTLTPAFSLSLHHYASPNGRLHQFQALQPCCGSFLYKFRAFCTNWTRSLSSSRHTLSYSLAELPSQIIMSVPELRKGTLCLCDCGCNHQLSRWTRLRHQKQPLRVQPESPPPPKWRRITYSQAGQESFIIRPSKQKPSSTDNNSSISHSCADAGSSPSDHPQLHAPSPKFNPSLPLLDLPPALHLLQSPEDALTEASGLFVNDVLLNHHTRTYQTTNQSDDEDSEGCYALRTL
jgi:hypothetical protein